MYFPVRTIIAAVLCASSACIRDAPGRDASVTDATAALDGNNLGDVNVPDAAVNDGAIDTSVPLSGMLVFDDSRVRAIDPATLQAARSACRPPILAYVDHIVDGDTIVVHELPGARNEHIRLIGVNAPEIGHAPGESSECFGPESTEFTRMLERHVVWLTFGTTCLDPYERTLAFVHIGGAPGGMWQRQMLRRGYARAFPFRDNNTFESMFAADQNAGRAASAGLWSTCE